MQNRFRLGAAIVLLLFSLTSFAAATAPDTMLRSVAEEMFETLKANQEEFRAQPEQLFKLVEKVLVPHVDMEAMARLVLGVNWRRATEEQRERFTAEFKTLMVRFYVSALLEQPDQIDRLLQNTEGLIEFLPANIDPGADRARVRSQVSPPDGPAVPVSFSLYRKDDRWLVYDVNVDGVSIIVNYRSSFASQISREGLPTLIDNLAARNEKLWQETVNGGQ